MHVIYRNFISALRFNKTAAILNIMGLAIAYIVFATIYAQVDFANKFDRFHPQVDHIYRVDCKNPCICMVRTFQIADRCFCVYFSLYTEKYVDQSLYRRMLFYDRCQR